MRKIYSTLFVLLLSSLTTSVWAQCGTPYAGGSATNMFTHIRNLNNPVAANKDLNTVVFIHRQNINTFSGNSGNLRYDISTNGGSSWTIDQGILNPVSTNFARYPNVVIYNPALNTSTANAYIGYLAATINSATSVWNGMVTGVRNLGGSGNTENYNQPAIVPNNVPGSVVKGAPGVFWGIDDLLNASNYPVSFTIYKGVWNASTSDISWSSAYSATPPFNTALAGVPFVSEYHIAFDPTGTYGWMSFSGHVSPGPSNYAFYPVFYKTTDGGATWTGPIQVDLNQLSCAMSNIQSGNIIGTNGEHNLTVDVNGNPHFFTPVVNGSNGYGVYYNLWHHMFDITMDNGMWVAYDIANVNAGPASWGSGANFASQTIAPQISRSRDGHKIFYCWTDNSTYSAGAANTTPDFFSMGFDVQTKQFTGIKNFSGCNATTAGKILFPHVAEEALEPSGGSYKLAMVYGELNASGDPGQAANFKFLDNCLFASTEFSVAAPSASVHITQGHNVLACTGSTINLTLNSGLSQVLWSVNNTTTSTLPVSAAGHYSVIASNGCSIGKDSIIVTTMSFTPSMSSASICPGSTTTLSVLGNANSYVWQPGNYTGSVAVVSPAAATDYTLSAFGDALCSNTMVMSVGVYTPPVISIAGNTVTCVGAGLTQTVSGAATYSWGTGETSAVVSFTPVTPTTPIALLTYTVYGFDLNNCSDTATVSIVVNISPTVTASSSSSMICKGETATLTAHGANSYTWSSTQATTSALPISPTVTTTYTVTGTNAAGCTNAVAFTEVVSLCTGIDAALSGYAAVMIYPNPNNGRFTLSAENAEAAAVEIYNSVGQKIMRLSRTQTTQEIDLSQQASGIYFVHLIDNGHIISSTRLIKQ